MKDKNKQRKKRKMVGGNILFEDCIMDIIKDKWTPIKHIGKGVNGNVYQICNQESCDNVIKIYTVKKNTKEGEISEIAGNINVGPKVIDYGMCGPRNTGYIISEKLTLTFEEHLKLNLSTCNDIVQILKLYNKLLINNINQNDLKPANIMINSNGNFKIIDYGQAYKYSNITDNERLKYLINGASYLIGTIESINFSFANLCKKQILSQINIL